MKSQIFKLTTLIVLLTAVGFSATAQNNRAALSSANDRAPSSTKFAIDKNIISVEISNLVDAHTLEYAPYPDYGGGGPNVWSPHFWTIKMFMAEGTDITSLAPIINLAPGATITSKHARVQDFSKEVEYTVICEDGSTVTYFFSAYTQEKTRGVGTLYIECEPYNGGSTSPFLPQTYDGNALFYCTAFENVGYLFEGWYVNGSKAGINTVFFDYIPMADFGYATLRAKFAPKPAVYYTVTVLSEDLVMGTVTPYTASVLSGSSVTVTATPKSGYAFEGWYLNGSKWSDSPTFNFTPSSNCHLYARFVGQHTVTVQSESIIKGYIHAIGDISGTPGASTVVPVVDGGSVTVYATAYQGYAFEGWYLNGSNTAISNITSFSYFPSSNCTFLAKFVPNSQENYTVTVQSESTAKGTVSPSVGSVAAGGFIQVTATPKSGYIFEGWYLNGSKISSSASYPFYPSATSTLIAKFTSISSSCISNFSNQTVTTNTIIYGCSTLTVQNVTVSNNATLTIVSGGSVTFDNFDLNPGAQLDLQ